MGPNGDDGVVDDILCCKFVGDMAPLVVISLIISVEKLPHEPFVHVPFLFVLFMKAAPYYVGIEERVVFLDRRW